MRVAFIADIHSNVDALQAVLEDIDRRGADQVWCLGDIVGYGPQPRECLALVRQRASLCISGNHDLAAAGALDLGEFNPDAAAANRWTGQALSGEEKEHLGALPSARVAQQFTLAHGSPREPVWEYVLSIDVAIASFGHFETRYCLVGHSHIPFLCPEPASGEPCRFYRLEENAGVNLNARRFIINPGSVGQPRDGDPRSSYAIYDSQQGALYHYRVLYDVASTQAKMRKACLPAYLIDRLTHGR